MTRKKALSADNQQGRLHHRLEPWYVSGFIDGEGSFHIAIYQDQIMKTGWKVIPEFHVSQRVSSRCVLDALVRFFKCGYVKMNHRLNPKDVTYVYVVRDRKDLATKIMPFFRRYKLQTEKKEDFKKFSQIIELMLNERHRTSVGLKQIIKIAYSMNGSGRYRKRPKKTIL